MTPPPLSNVLAFLAVIGACVALEGACAAREDTRMREEAAYACGAAGGRWRVINGFGDRGCSMPGEVTP
ncbi:MAG: hypothetical protein AAGH15_05255 [Myxococcota bacterium]